MFLTPAGRDQVMQLMLQAQRWDATDADAHVVLGVLYNVSRDYDSAAEAFRRAIEARPGDHSLWNKVGGMPGRGRACWEGGGVVWVCACDDDAALPASFLASFFVPFFSLLKKCVRNGGVALRLAEVHLPLYPARS